MHTQRDGCTVPRPSTALSVCVANWIPVDAVMIMQRSCREHSAAEPPNHPKQPVCWCHLSDSGLTLYSKELQSAGSSMVPHHTWPTVHVRGRASFMLHEPREGWLPTSTTSWPGLVVTVTFTSTCKGAYRPQQRQQQTLAGGHTDHSSVSRQSRNLEAHACRTLSAQITIH
jgi:hypothetical protein